MPHAPLYQPVIVAPTFNNAPTLARVLEGLAQSKLPIIVVNDGCTDGSADILRQWQQGGGDRTVISHPRNRGKASALRNGFRKALAMGFTHAVTIDTDGQLDPAEIGLLLHLSRRLPGALILGSRGSEDAGYPAASRLGRWASNVLIEWESGLRVSDSQCGFRVYPLAATQSLRCVAPRYGFETEILTRAAWAGIAVRGCRVSCNYILPEGRVSHFRPWRDSLACAGLHIRLLTRSLMPRSLPRSPYARNHFRTGTIWQRVTHWLNPVRAWRAIRNDPAERSDFARGLAIGVFIANCPLYGFQTILCLFAARRLRLNPLPILIGSHLATPPINAVLIALAIAVGHVILHGTLPVLRSFNPAIVGYVGFLRSVVMEWIVGSLVCGTVLAALTFIISQLVLRLVPLKRPPAPADHPAAPAPGRAAAVEESMA